MNIVKITHPDGTVSSLHMPPEAGFNSDDTIAEARRLFPHAELELVASDPVRPRVRQIVEAECARRIRNAIDGKDASLLREAAWINNLVANGIALTDEQKAEGEMFKAINDWETRMIVARETMIARGADEAAADNANWPEPPPGLPEFLTGF